MDLHRVGETQNAQFRFVCKIVQHQTSSGAPHVFPMILSNRASRRREKTKEKHTFTYVLAIHDFFSFFFIASNRQTCPVHENESLIHKRGHNIPKSTATQPIKKVNSLLFLMTNGLPFISSHLICEKFAIPHTQKKKRTQETNFDKGHDLCETNQQKRENLFSF